MNPVGKCLRLDRRLVTSLTTSRDSMTSHPWRHNLRL